ncbi:14043_t:CDS:2 [Funneliformis geosporum]|uniref:10857_t:CDS:1 n=1 Tax=Funneliformis geosporum TaxID=1117311 RepID=A0A9W4WNK7_9GLOM|nr:14043_t:CDS:2 [Funneliformis geosporum]CAI2175270.1 10857_t:CDS:2 [Funneliformis geosporum]
MALQYRENEYCFHDEDEQTMLLRALALSLEKDNNNYHDIASGSMGLGPASPHSGTQSAGQKSQFPRMVIIHPPKKNIFRKLFEGFLGFCLLSIKTLILAASFAFSFIFLIAINVDHQKEIENRKSEVEREIQDCSLKYLENRCNPVTRAPYLENNCTFWEDCMNRNPSNNVKEAELYAKQMARIISIFLENLSYEARMMFFVFLVMIFGYITFKNHK